jgi:hypothetical protein
MPADTLDARALVTVVVVNGGGVDKKRVAPECYNNIKRENFYLIAYERQP